MNLHSNNKGQALVEMALSIILLMTILVGIFEFGRAMYIKNTLNNAARAGVRKAVVTSGIQKTTSSEDLQCDSYDPTTKTGNIPVYISICDSLYNGVDKDNVTVDIILIKNTANSSSPAYDANIIQTSDTVEVTVRLSGFTSFTKLIPITNQLTGVASMRYE